MVNTRVNTLIVSISVAFQLFTLFSGRGEMFVTRVLKILQTVEQQFKSINMFHISEK